MTEVDLEALLSSADDHVVEELSSMPDVVLKGHDLDIAELPFDERVWHRVDDAVTVFTDLKASTQLGLNKKAPSTASIYEAATGNVASIFAEFGADFLAIQGDGAFALFWGDHRKRRAVCAGITVKTFSERHLVPRLEKKWEELPETGIKVGIANSPLLVKRVGLEGSDSHEPVWAGRAVNYAAKCAQQADRGQLIATGSIWDWISGNDYLAASCDCGDPSSEIWSDVTIDKIPDIGDGEREGKLLTSIWCAVHGADYCSTILDGKRSRTNVTNVVTSALTMELSHTNRRMARETRARIVRAAGLAAAEEQQRRDRNARSTGLNKIH